MVAQLILISVLRHLHLSKIRPGQVQAHSGVRGSRLMSRRVLLVLYAWPPPGPKFAPGAVYNWSGAYCEYINLVVHSQTLAVLFNDVYFLSSTKAVMIKLHLTS